MRLCFDCVLRERPRWLERYAVGWYVLLLYGAAAFATLNGKQGYWAQAIFFLVLFPWIVWPLVAAVRTRIRR